METPSPTTFRHRHNRNDSWDSICTKCFLTVETAMVEEELTGAERSHDCAELFAIKTGMKPLLSEPVEGLPHEVRTHD